MLVGSGWIGAIYMAKPACIMRRTGGREAGDSTAHSVLTLLQGRASELQVAEAGDRGL